MSSRNVHSRSVPRILLMALMAGLLAPAASYAFADAPDANTAAQPDARVLLQQAEQSMRGLRSVSYSARRWSTGSLALSTPDVRGRVAIDGFSLGSEPSSWTFGLRGTRIGGSDGVAHEFTTVSRDGTLIAVRHATREVLEGHAQDADEVLPDGGEWMLTWLRHWSKLVSGPVLGDGTADVEWLGRRTVGEVLCDVVRVDYNADQSLRHAWLYLAPADRLPRRVDVQYGTEGAEVGFAILELSDMQVNQAIDPGAFRWSLPPGFEAKPLLAKGRVEPEAEPQPEILRAGRTAPDFTLSDPENNQIKLSGLAGSVVVIDFWAVWCGPCVRAMPAMQKLHDDYKDKGVKVFGINTWETDGNDPVQFKKDKGLTYGLLLKGDKVAEAFGVAGIPAFFVIGKDGKILYGNTGFGPAVDTAMREAIEQGLKP